MMDTAWDKLIDENDRLRRELDVANEQLEVSGKLNRECLWNKEERIAALLDENAAIKRTFEMQQTRIATLEALVLEYGEEIGRLRREFSQQILRSKP